MKTWSLTPFFNELDVLEIRLAELDPVVDVHVIAESTLTYSGEPKPLHFLDNAERFAPWRDKIRYVAVTDSPVGGVDPDPRRVNPLTACASGRWRRENHQRDALSRALDGLKRDDLVLLSDVDEIPRADVVVDAHDRVPRRSDRLIRPALDLHMYHLNWRWLVPVTVICRFMRGGLLLDSSPERVRQLVATHDPLPARDLGWHFSYLGGIEAIRYKLRSAAHHEVDVPPYNTTEHIEHCIRTGADLFGRDRPMVSVPLTRLPDHVRLNARRFRHLLGPELPRRTPTEVRSLVTRWTW